MNVYCVCTFTTPYLVVSVATCAFSLAENLLVSVSCCLPFSLMVSSTGHGFIVHINSINM